MHDAIEELLWENRRLFRALAAAADAALARIGLTATERALLEFIVRHEAPVSLSELARKHSVSRQHVHQSMPRLEARGWVVRSADPADARTVRVRLTRSGRAAWKRIRTVDATILGRLAPHVDAGTARSTAVVLRQLREVLES